MGIQTDHDDNTPLTLVGGASTVAPAPTGYGGNRCLVNQDEGEIAECAWERTAIQQAPDGYAEDLSTTQGVFRFPAL